MKIVVTGALGFVGSNLVDSLISLGHDVKGIDNLSSSSSTLGNGNRDATYEIGDFMDSKTLDEEFDVVYHLAADARIQPSFDKPLETFHNNAFGTAYVAEKARGFGAKMIFSSTSSSLHGDYVSPYTLSKRSGEEYLKMMANCYDLDCSSARFFNVYGPREPWSGEYATVVRKFQRQWENGEPMTVVGDGTQSRDFTHVDDICSGLIAIMEEKRSGEIINLGRNHPYTIMDLVKMYAGEEAIEGKDWLSVPLRKNEGQRTQWFETVKLNWEPKINLPDYIAGIVSAVQIKDI
jgi:UDP-glucose 4-epimerase